MRFTHTADYEEDDDENMYFSVTYVKMYSYKPSPERKWNYSVLGWTPEL